MLTNLFTPLLLSAALIVIGNKSKEPPQPVAQSSAGKMVQKVYPVADFIVPIRHDDSEDCQARQKLVRGVLALLGNPEETTEAWLVKLICTTVEPSSWRGAGGRGMIEFHPVGLGLVVYNTQGVQEQVADLLAALHRLVEVEVAVEVRLVGVSETLLEDLGVDADSKRDASQATDNCQATTTTAESPGAALSDPAGMAFLNDVQVRHLLAAAQADPRSITMQAPRLTVLNGQKARIDLTQKQFFVTELKRVREGDQVVVVPKNEAFPTGFRMSVLPIVTADRRSVVVKLQADLTTLESSPVPVVPVSTNLVARIDKDGQEQVVAVRQFVQQPSFQTLKVNKSFLVGDGQTAVLRWGARVVEGHQEIDTGPPVLSKIPYLNRMFRNVGYRRETQTLLLLVTPRIIINEEEEHIYLGTMPPLPRP